MKEGARATLEVLSHNMIKVCTKSPVKIDTVISVLDCLELEQARTSLSQARTKLSLDGACVWARTRLSLELVFGQGQG